MLNNYNKLQKIKEKYPWILISNDSRIDLELIGSYINMINSNNFSSADLRTLGLQDLKKDLPWILSDIRQERREKLDKLKNL